MKVLFAIVVLFCSCRGYAQTTFTIYFDFNRHDLTANARLKLDSFLIAEKENLPGSVFRLDGYCDFIGSDNYNKTLSGNRVSAVKNYLLKHSIGPGPTRNVTVHGEKDPLNENKTEEERQLNRRVTITFIKADQASLSASKENFSLTEKIADTATKAGTNIVLKNMNFYGGTPFLLPESFSTLDELFEVMRVNHNLVIEIQGHICCIASPGDSPYGGTGNGLSEERTKMIYAELIGKGINPDRISYKGFGHSMPIYPYPEKTEEERTANRRVEIKIISK
jgi:outer membrane protein OmpA-like peptidoglycan-associated protein